MKIFICWSGTRSHQIADEMSRWLPKVIGPGLEKSFVSSRIEKGTLWFDVISQELESSDAGLIILTPEALKSPWIHFEAGALAKTYRSKPKGKIYTYLFGVEPAELNGPMAAYQYTTCSREDTFSLVASIITQMDKQAPAPEIWEANFNACWPEFEKVLDEMRQLSIQELIEEGLLPNLEELFQRKTFNEPLNECAHQNWIDRYNASQITMETLRRYLPVVRENCPPHQVDLYYKLISQLDGYTSDQRALLIHEEKFELGEDGKLKVDTGKLIPCERRREEIKQLLVQLAKPDGAPVFGDDSRRYARLSSLAERKSALVHPYERKIRKGVKLLDDDEMKEGESMASEKVLESCATSLWEFDRIVYYMVREHQDRPDLRDLIACVSQELEKLEALTDEGSTVPLHYALRALTRKVCGDDRRAEIDRQLHDLIGEVKRYIGTPGRDAGGHIRHSLNLLEEKMKFASEESAAHGRSSN